MGVYDLTLSSYSLGSSGLSAGLNGRWHSSPHSWVGHSSSNRSPNHSEQNNRSVSKLDEIRFEPGIEEPEQDELPNNGLSDYEIVAQASEGLEPLTIFVCYAIERLKEKGLPTDEFENDFHEIANVGASSPQLALHYFTCEFLLEMGCPLSFLTKDYKKACSKGVSLSNLLEISVTHILSPGPNDFSMGEIPKHGIAKFLDNVRRNIFRRVLMNKVEGLRAELDF